MSTPVMEQNQNGTAGLTGRVSRVLGAVVDVEFPRGALPAQNIQLMKPVNMMLTIQHRYT